MRDSLVIDMLNQFLYRADQAPILERWLKTPGAFSRQDWTAFKDTGVNAISFGDGADTFEGGVRLFTDWNRFIDRHPQWLLRIQSAADFDLAKRSGRYGIMFGIQDGGLFRSAADVDTFYRMGLRLSQLTYNGQNQLGSGAMVEVDSGLTPLGADVVARMNNLGMAVDIAHAGDRTQKDVLALSRRPVMLSHGACRALNPRHPRTISDETIIALARSGGVMGIPFTANMIKDADSRSVTVDDVIDHVDHVGRLVGFDHVGIGSDAGIESNDFAPPEAQRRFWARINPRYRQQGPREVVRGLDGQKKIFTFTEGLVRRGYSDATIRLVLGGNWRRALASAWGPGPPQAAGTAL